MGYNIANVTVNRAAIDNYLRGFGFNYDYWADEMAKSRVVLANYTKLLARVPDRWSFQLTSDLNDDARNLEAAANAYSDAMVQISAGKKINKAQLKTIIQIQSGLVEALDLENDNLDAILSIGLFAAFMDHQFRNIEIAAANAKPKVEALEKALKEAKKKVREAEVQGAVDTGLLVIGFFLPEISVLTKVTIAVGQWAMDDYLGGDKSSSTVDNASNVNSGVNVGQQAVEDWKIFAPKTAKAVKIGGKAIAVTGLYFDANEIHTAMEQADITQKTLDDAIQAMYVVQALLDRTRPAMTRLKLQLIKVAQTLKDTQLTIDNIHNDVWGIMKQARWDPNVVWKLEP